MMIGVTLVTDSKNGKFTTANPTLELNLSQLNPIKESMCF